jgi:hypothetical protein
VSEYTCAACHGTFNNGWTDEEAKAELGEHFPGTPVDACEEVCDECYNAITATLPADIVPWRDK